jgi:hypothetical protein
MAASATATPATRATTSETTSVLNGICSAGNSISCPQRIISGKTLSYIIDPPPYLTEMYINTVKFLKSN